MQEFFSVVSEWVSNMIALSGFLGVFLDLIFQQYPAVLVLLLIP